MPGLTRTVPAAFSTRSTLTRMYVQYDQMELHFAGPTPTPRPITSTETEQAAQFKKLWEAGCETGRRDAVGREAS